MKGDNKFFNLLKSTRVKRIMPILVLILIPAASINKFEPTLMLLGLNIILIYAASSIYNAHKDNDYDLPSYFPIIIFILIAIAIAIAISSKPILIASCLWIILGIIYNTTARFMVLGDGIVLGFTHFALPIATASILVGLNTNTIVILSSLTYFIGICITPNTDLKDIESDRKRKYKTLVNSTKKPEVVAGAFLAFSILIFSFIYIFLCQNIFCLFFLIPTIIICAIIIKLMLNKKYKRAMDLMRLYLISAYIFLIINLTLNLKIIITAFTVSYFYLLIILVGQNFNIQK